MNARILILCLALVGLSACASTQTGQLVRQKPQALGQLTDIRPVGEPFHDVSLAGDIGKVEEVGASFVELPNPLPLYWKNELVDPSRSLKEKRGDRLVAVPHLRRVFRVGIYRDEQLVAMHEAVVNPDGRRLLLLLPASAGRDYQGMNLLILSHDAYFGVTSDGKIVELGKRPNPGLLPPGFFASNPSPLPPVVVLRRSDPAGLGIYTDLESVFPIVFTVNGVSYSGTKNALKILAEFTPADQWQDRVITCGSATIAFPLALDPITGGIQLARNAMAATRGCYRGDRH